MYSLKIYCGDIINTPYSTPGQSIMISAKEKLAKILKIKVESIIESKSGDYYYFIITAVEENLITFVQNLMNVNVKSFTIFKSAK